MITRICQHCHREYSTFPSIKPQYCSHKCASEAKISGEFVPCAQCGKEFWRYKSKPDRLYCSKSCAATARNLTDSNPAYHRDITGENNPMHGVKLIGVDNPMFGKRREKCSNWKGGKRHRPDGYIRVVVPDDYPNPCDQKNGTKYVLEHRYVMEQHIGRYLRPEEVVHHIDGDQTNNAIENLQLFADQADHMAIAHSNKSK